MRGSVNDQDEIKCGTVFETVQYKQLLRKLAWTLAQRYSQVLNSYGSRIQSWQHS